MTKLELSVGEVLVEIGATMAPPEILEARLREVFDRLAERLRGEALAGVWGGSSPVIEVLELEPRTVEELLSPGGPDRVADEIHARIGGYF